VVSANGIRIHLVEEGSGPLVLFVHGFPESWYSWRHQLPAVAAAGFRAAAIDVRGYGRSSAPYPVSEYGMLRHVADNLGVVAALGEERAIIVGHDWGAPIASHSALLRPDVFHACALLSVPYRPPGGPQPVPHMIKSAGPDHLNYMVYFQDEGVAEAEAEADMRSWIIGMMIGASADAPPLGDGRILGLVRKGERFCDSFPVITGVGDLPPWLTAEDADFYVAEFERTGLRGGLNRYRNLDRDWADFQAWAGHPLVVASLFIGGTKDGPTVVGGNAIARFEATMPDLRGSHIIESGHWIQQERASEVNSLLVGWLESLAL
jgi:pimeloyl-ACP methyl ester carboxylesterase